jgi:lipoprotein signal peptidase
MTLDAPHAEPRPSRLAALRSPAALLTFVLTTVIGLTVDLWTKSYAWNHLVIDPQAQLERDPYSGHLRVDSHTARPIPGWLHFKVTVNEGAVFGLGQGKRAVFAVVSVAAIGFLAYLFATSGSRRFYQFVLGMLLAGVLGNLYDRMVYKYVRDMLYALPGRPGRAAIASCSVDLQRRRHAVVHGRGADGGLQLLRPGAGDRRRDEEGRGRAPAGPLVIPFAAAPLHPVACGMPFRRSTSSSSAGPFVSR